MNPANLRWKYTIESLINVELEAGNTKIVSQLEECLSSLAKFPLVLEDVTHCAILCGFDAHIIKQMKFSLDPSGQNASENGTDNCLSGLANWNLSPIAKRRHSGKMSVHFIRLLGANWEYRPK